MPSVYELASEAQSDEHQTGDQEVAGLIPAGSRNILLWKFSMVILSLQLIQDGQLSVSDERMCTSTGEPLRGQSLPRKSVVR